MDEVSATYRDGIFVTDQPVDWPEGTPVVVLRSPSAIGLDESNWPTTKEGIKEWLAWFDSLEPVEFTPEEQERIDAARAAARKENIEAMGKNWGELENLF